MLEPFLSVYTSFFHELFVTWFITRWFLWSLEPPLVKHSKPTFAVWTPHGRNYLGSTFGVNWWHLGVPACIRRNPTVTGLAHRLGKAIVFLTVLESTSAIESLSGAIVVSDRGAIWWWPCLETGLAFDITWNRRQSEIEMSISLKPVLIWLIIYFMKLNYVKKGGVECLA